MWTADEFDAFVGYWHFDDGLRHLYVGGAKLCRGEGQVRDRFCGRFEGNESPCDVCSRLNNKRWKELYLTCEPVRK